MPEYKTIQVQHIDEVHAIEKQCYQYDFLTTVQLEKLIKQLSVDGYVAIHRIYNEGLEDDYENKIVGYIIFNDDLEIIRLGVHPDYRRQGIGTELLNTIKNKLKPKRDKLTIHVPDYAKDGHLFLASQGCVAADVIRNHFRKSHSDSYEFVFRFEWMRVLI